MGMQDDLRAYEDYFTDELTKLINARSKEIQTAYRRIEKKAVAKLEKLDKEIEKLPEEKRQTKRVQREMQRRYVEGLLPDLEQLNAAQNPYIAITLANTFEHGYYTRAFMLEQAAKTPVEIPRLNRSGVLGLVVNDWVGDRRTYSARLRANTLLVARKTKGVIEDLVAQRQSYNEAARSLSGKITEGYNNTIRIVRTEMTRANALGSSYAAMENADILGGKYRDATFDSRTSPMCAADADYSRAHPYPLDYDTPENPGVPTHRIPNHPNCRCCWRYILDSIGIVDRQRLARQNDSKDSYGDNYYTKAATFDEYAKERGLPSIAEMLAKDNPKRYLRPGETTEDLKRTYKDIRKKVRQGITMGIVLDKAVERDIINVKGGKKAMQSRAIYGALNPESEKDFARCEEHANRYYEEIRKRKSDVAAIAKNTGYSERDIEIIKSHIFLNKYDLGEDEPTRFYPSYDIAVSWQNLIEGKNIEEKDLILLKHEYYEYGLMTNEGLSYFDAHIQAQKLYNYKKAVDDWRTKV